MKKELIEFRSEIVKRIRAFFDERGYTEVHTPRMVLLPGQEPYLDPFWTTLHDIHGGTHERALITSPEYVMKKLLATGFDKIYDLGPCFRDHEPWDGTHAPEFLMLEWYRKGVGLLELMDETEELVRHVANSELRMTNNEADKAKFDIRNSIFELPFRRMTVAEAMKRYANIDLDPLLGDRERLAALVVERGGTNESNDTWDDLFFKIFLTEVEPKLGWNADKTEWRPTFLWNYPLSQAALAEKNPKDPRYALRAELYIADLELGNGFEELTDAEEQRERFLEEIEIRKSLEKRTWAIDEELLAALPVIGKSSGMSFGVDRLVMLLSDAEKLTHLTNG